MVEAELMAVQVEVRPVLAGAAARTAEHLDVEVRRRCEVGHRQGEVEGGHGPGLLSGRSGVGETG